MALRSILFTLITFVTLSSQTYQVEWVGPDDYYLPSELGTAAQYSDFLWDANGDGVSEMIMNNFGQDYFKVFDYRTNTVIWEYDIASNLGLNGALLGFADFDGDGLREAIISLHDDNGGHYYSIYDWQSNTEEYQLPDQLEAIFDIDIDGLPEMIVSINLGTGIRMEVHGCGLPVSNNSENQQLTKQILGSNYPNPFNPSTTIPYVVTHSGKGEIRIFNVSGQQVDLIPISADGPGTYTMKWSGPSLESGQYFYQIYFDGNMLGSRKMLVLK